MESATTTVAAVDLISGLHDDVLLRILSFLPAASDVARTSVLSRRWRHLWSNTVALRFAIGSEPKTYRYTQADRDEARRLIAVVNNALEQRAAGGPDMEDLEVSFVYSSEDNTYIDGPYIGYSYRHYHAADITSSHVATWLQFAMCHVTRRFTLAVPTVPKRRQHYAMMAADAEEEEDHNNDDDDDNDDDIEAEEEEEEKQEGDDEAVDDTVNEEEEEWKPMPEYEYETKEEEERVLSAELPFSAKIKEMSLTLGKAILTVPATHAGAFRSLTYIHISHARLDAGADHSNRLDHLLSSSCSPNLKKLQLKYIEGISELHLDATGTLEELLILGLRDLWSLDVDAQGLCVLGVKECFGISSVRISAPRLEVLACEQMGHADKLRFDGASSVRCIEELHLSSHRLRHCENEDDYYYDNSAAVWFLQHCVVVDRLMVNVTWPWWCSQKKLHVEETDLEDNTLHIPQLPNVRNLKIEVYGWLTEHNIEATVSKLIAKCTEIEDLCIDLNASRQVCSDQNCICNHPTGSEVQNISLGNLRTIQIHDFVPFDNPLRLVHLLLTSTPVLERMTLELNTICYDSREVIQFHIPCYGGCWEPKDWQSDHELATTWATKYEWTRAGKEGEVGGTRDLDGLCIH
ncbi:hypothetical protein ACP70R_033182 [Stipagrostis hirtigluma subsp. patula]